MEDEKTIKKIDGRSRQRTPEEITRLTKQLKSGFEKSLHTRRRLNKIKALKKQKEMDELDDALLLELQIKKNKEKKTDELLDEIEQLKKELFESKLETIYSESSEEIESDENIDIDSPIKNINVPLSQLEIYNLLTKS